ncbi:ASCH domain-containing protein [Streptomyces celluloflavus]|uniref:ASCH domain-containing protein n=1 Tax=Streptomyces celluloflavus TaxID=58344 RepID=UPI0036CD0F99
MTESAARIRELNLYRRYFGLVAAGKKTTEVRVKYPHLADLAAGDVIRFRIKGTDETCDVLVKKVTEVSSLERKSEKVLVGPRGEIVGRIRPRADPGANELIEAIEAALPA